MQLSHRWIDDANELERFCASIDDGEVVAVDTESDHFFAYRPYVALIQVATRDQAVLVDPLELTAEQLDPLMAIVEAPEVIKIMHSARNDIGELDRDWGIIPTNVFDTQLAARFLGYEKFGLNALLQKTQGITLDKKYQRFDWSRRPIPEPAQQYAIGDVVYLFDLRERLLRELEAEGWLRAFEEQMEHLIVTSGYSASEFDPEDWRKLKGAKTLEDPSRAICARLFRYRHELCDRLNRAPLHILDNGTLVKIARQRPKTKGELGRIKGMRPQTLRYNGDDIIEIIEQAQHDPPPPARRPRTGPKKPRPSPDSRERLKTLLSVRQDLAEQTDLAIDVVLNRNSLEAIAEIFPSSIDELVEIPDLLRWQRELFGAQLLDAIR